MRATSLLLNFLIVPVLVMLVTGCTSRTWIKPADIAVFTKPPSDFRGATPIRSFTGADRRMVRVKGEPDVRLYLVGGGEKKFEGPVIVKDLGDQRFAINDGRQQDFEFGVDTISSVALERTNFWKGAAWAGLGVGAFLGVALIVAGFSGGVKVDNTTTTSQ